MKYQVTVVERYYKIIEVEAETPEWAIVKVAKSGVELGDEDWWFDGAKILVSESRPGECPELMTVREIRYYE